MLGTRLCTLVSSFFLRSLTLYRCMRFVEALRYDGNCYKKTSSCLD